MEFALPERYVDVSLLTSQENRRVLRCRDKETDRWVAIKCLVPPVEDIDVEAFRTEYLRLEAIDHPNWVRPDRFFALPSGGYGFDLELSAGAPLLEMPFRGWCPEVAEVSRQILSGLHALHVMGTAHLDLKPEQILVSWEVQDSSPPVSAAGPESGPVPGDEDSAADGESRGDHVAYTFQVHLLDLGLSHPFGARIPPTGTAGYMAPEILRGDPDWDCRVDLYAFGVVLYELIWGRMPFEGDTAGELVRSQLFGVDLAEELRARKIPQPIVHLVAELLEVGSESRPRSASEVFDRISASASSGGWAALSPDLAEARGFPFVGREGETRTFGDWWTGLPSSNTPDPGGFELSIESEHYFGAERFRERLVAIAQVLGGSKESDDSLRTESGVRVSIQVVPMPASMNCHPTTYERPNVVDSSGSYSNLVIRLGTDSREALLRMAESRGLASPALCNYLVKECWERQVLLWGMIESVSDAVRRHRWHEDVEFDRCLDRTPPSELAIEWMREAYPSLSTEERLLWVADSLVLLARSERWCYPSQVNVGIDRPLLPSAQMARWILTVASRDDIETAVDSTLRGSESRIDEALIRTVGGVRENPSLDAAFELLIGQGYFETVIRIFLDCVRIGVTPDLVSALPSLLRVLVITGRTQFPPNSMSHERARNLDKHVRDGALFECMFLLAEGRETEASAALSGGPPTDHPAREVWRTLRQQLGEAVSHEDTISDSQNDPEAQLWREARSLGSAAPEEVVLFLSGLRDPQRDPSRTWRVAMWAATDAYAKNELEAAADAIRWVVDADRRWSNGSIAATAYMNLATIDYERGQLKEARQLLSAVVDESRLLGIQGLFSSAISNLCAVTAEMGMLDETLVFAESARKEGQDRSGPLLSWLRSGWLTEVIAETDSLDMEFDDPEVAACARHRGVAQLLAGDPHGRDLLLQVAQAARQSQAPGDLVDTLTDWLLAELDTGGAVSVVHDELRELVPAASGISRIRGSLAIAQSDMLSGYGETEFSLRQLDDIERDIEDSSLRYYAWRVHWLRAELLLRADFRERSKVEFERVRDALLDIVVPLGDLRHERRFLALPGCQRALARYEDS